MKLCLKIYSLSSLFRKQVRGVLQELNNLFPEQKQVVSALETIFWSLYSTFRGM